MQTENTIEIKKLIYKMTVEYKELFDDERLELWVDTLKDFNLQDIKIAFHKALLTYDFFPKISQIVKLIPQGISIKSKAMTAWEELKIHLGKSWKPIDDITRDIAQRLGGISHLAHLNFDDLERRRSQFVDLYIDTAELLQNENLKNKFAIEFKNTDGE